ncbi:general secretion pathway protein GspB [Photobacterium atrarenae]|uniref:General secretion pathway protein GspB n=1 Tax=Photobacterium atrarenae TaxID=865757 RepID=A0ABY5GF94_9GAMM|nr:general secretion pathway protein GspB [Photobacterium atrarenae]UTV27399.1 general secretion pathway protein GspB [Photobacterium atrarenae]
MSQLLKAIARSDRLSPQPPQAKKQGVKPVTPAKRWPRWVVPVLLVASPVAATLSYSRLLSASAVTVQADPAPQAPVVRGEGPSARQPAAATAAGEIRFLPYPEFHTEPLPSVGQLLSEAPIPSGRARPAPVTTDAVAVEAQHETAAEATEWSLDALDYSELSPQLAAQLKSAIAATDEVPKPLPSPPAERTEPVVSAIALGELPASVQSRIPALNFQTHIYSSSANSRWVKVNGREAFEGDEIAPGVILRRIEPRQVVFDFESYLVAMPALSEW